jgi:hypothetical protein
VTTASGIVDLPFEQRDSVEYFIEWRGLPDDHAGHSHIESLNLEVTGVTTVDASRTFWDKVIIMHGQRRWFERRGELQHQGQRVSRHYYDVYRMLESDAGPRASADGELALDCVRHARMFSTGQIWILLPPYRARWR